MLNVLESKSSILGVLLFSAILFFVIFQILKKFGLAKPIFKSKADKEEQKRQELEEKEKTEKLTASYTLVNNPKFEVDYSYSNLTDGKAQELAQILESAFKPWYFGGDDETKVYTVLNSLRNSKDLSKVNAFYKNLTGYDLRNKIIEKFDDSEILTVNKIIQKLA